MKKIFFSVTLVSIFALAFTLTAKAEEVCPTLAAGSLFKVKGHSAVYMVDETSHRLYFPNSEVFHSWYKDFSAVTEISEACVDKYPTPLDPPFGVNFRPGARLVKLQISPSVYVVEPGNRLRKIASETVAKELYGPNWANLVRDVADAFWPNFNEKGADLKEARPHDGMFVKTPNSTDIYYVKDGELEKVEGEVEDEDDIRIIGNGVFRKLAIKSGLYESKEAYKDAHQKARNPNAAIPSSKSSDDESEESDTLKIEDVRVSAGETSAIVKWETNVKADSKVMYSISSLSTVSTTLEVSSSTMSELHVFTLSDLTANTTYYFKVKSTDANNNTVESREYKFTTKDTLAPVISDLSVTVKSTSANLTWTTNEESEGKVKYGTTSTDYSFEEEATHTDSNGVFKFAAELSNLATSTTYYYEVDSKDHSDNKSSLTGSFTTLGQ